MAQRNIDIGIEGNDGTGDSIRESFRKTNENFTELYGAFGEGGRIDFAGLGDTPDTLTPATFPFVNETGTFLNLVEFASNSALDETEPDTIVFDTSVPGKLIISSDFTKVSDDEDPTLGGPLDAAGNVIANVGIDEEAVIEFNNRHGASINIDNAVISKGYADGRYLSPNIPIRVNDEPLSTDQYSLTIEDYAAGTGDILVPNHGFTRQQNGTAFVFRARYDAPDGLTNGNTYFLRFASQDRISVFENQEDAKIIDDTDASNLKIFLTGEIEEDDLHTFTDAAFDPDLDGNFLADVALPRNSVVRRQGDTMDGVLNLSDHPGDLEGFGIVNGEDDLQAATKFYVDNSAYSSPENLFVSTFGDDRMTGVPRGREGTALPYAFRTVSAAARRAAEIVETSPAEPGPYFQTVTTDNGEVDAVVESAEIINPENQQARSLLIQNLDYFVNEAISFLNYEFTNFEFDRNLYEGAYRSIIESIAFDINRGLTANFLTRKAAENYFNSIAGRVAITRQADENLSGIDFLKTAVSAILQNQLVEQNSVQAVEVEDARARVVTTNNHNYRDGEQIFFKDMGGMVEIEGLTAYVRVIDSVTLELYTDKTLENFWNISEFTDYTFGGRIGLVYQDRVEEFQSIKIPQTFDSPNAEEAARLAIEDKFDLIENILVNGIEAGADVIFGNNYKIVLNNGNQTFVDQGNPENTDTLPGKIMVGKISGAKGRIVLLTNNDPTENNNDTFELQQLNERDFLPGETVEYGNFVKKKQVTIFVESGIYEEDLPIKLANNVSLKGDEFRRVIIRPKIRTSQSIWADTYFYRDLEFDDIPLLEKQHSTVSSISSTKLSVEDVSWMSVDLPVTFTGNTFIGTEIEKNTTYYISSIDEQNLEIEIAETQGGSALSFATASGTMYIVSKRVAPFLNQTNEVQGYFGRFYLRDPYTEKNVGIIPQNDGGFRTASEILRLNRRFIQQEVIAYVTEEIETNTNQNNTGSIWFSFIYDEQRLFSMIGDAIDAIAEDLEQGGAELTLEIQGEFDLRTPANEAEQTSQSILQIGTITASLLNAVEPEQNGDVVPDISAGEAEAGTVALVGNLVNLVTFAFNTSYNPPKRNNADGVDVFMMSDATIVRNATVQGHGGFMVVLDPEEQILTKSPYIQTGSSFSKSDNEKRFRGGMYVDAFVGNIPARITNVVDPFQLEVESDSGQGLNIRPPQLPCPFYLDAVRYQVNAIANYDSGLGTATLFLDRGSNPDGSGVGQGYQGANGQEIFLQTAGNRSMLGNDFTQINDLGYGLVTNNGAFSEMVSMFTYYCQAAYYAKNGSEIRSLNGSNGYGFFGLVAEGADPNEIPDQVSLAQPMMQPCKAYTTAETPNVAEDPFIYVYDLPFTPNTESLITIDHGSEIGVLNYRISNVENFSDRDNDGVEGEGPDDIVATNGILSNTVYRLSLFPDNAVSDDFFGELQAYVPNNTFIEYRNNRAQIFTDVGNVDGLETRPSTAVNYEESFETTYRSLSFSTADALSQGLPNNTVLAIVEADFEFARLEVLIEELSVGFGLSQGDTKIPINPIPTQERINRLLRDVNGRLPSEAGYDGGGMIFSFAGKTHRITGYETDSVVTYIEFEDYGSNVSGYTGTGLAQGIPNDRERTIFAGLDQGSQAEITQAISLLRATGHDFTQIGTGSYNDSNYPNVILGEPENSEAEFYTDSPTATKSQVWERLKGRVFFVSTDQNGFFRVGKFFSIDQGTGDIEFAGAIGLTGANSLGFRRGVTIKEFSADDSFSDLSGRAVPTERATGGYIDRALGYNVRTNSQIKSQPEGNRIGPGFLPLNGFSAMEGDIDMGSNKIENLSNPGTDGTAAANKNYVDDIIKAYDAIEDLRNIEANNIEKNDIIVATGKKKIFVEPIQGGTWTVGETIGTFGGSKQGIIVDIEERADEIEGNIQIITYTLESESDFNLTDTIYNDGGNGTANTTLVDGPFDEIANAKEKTSSVVNLEVEREENQVLYNFQIQDESIVNADISTTAGISQSKLLMQKADTFDEDDPTTGWNGTAIKSQADLGLAKFSNENFETVQGFVRIKGGGIAYAEIQDVPSNTVLGRTLENEGSVSSIDFSTVVSEGGGLSDSDFDNTIVSDDEGFPGEALVKLGEGTYGVTLISQDVGPNTIARRRDNGFLDAAGYRVGGFDFVTLSSTTVRLSTPGGAEIFSAVGQPNNVTTRFPGNLDIGDTQLSSQSNFQAGSGFAGEGWLATDWIYTSFIEAAGERDGNSTGIGIGANTGFANAEDNVITLITNGGEKLVVRDTDTQVLNNLIVGSNQDNSITFNARLGSGFLPDQTSTRSLGSNSLRFNTVFADIFNGVATEAKYADLAENYIADNIYEPGTVVVFGGDEEITVTNKKADKRVAGIISENPAYLMNSDLDHANKHALALQGRVPCKVLGKVEKGDILVTSAIPGYAVVDNDARVGTVIGKALQDKDTDGKDIIEVVVGRV